MDKKIIVTLLFFIFFAGCAVVGTYVHDSKSEEDYSHDYRECADEARESSVAGMSHGNQMQFNFHSCLYHKGWKFFDEQGIWRSFSEDFKNKKIWSPKNKLTGPITIFQGF